MRKLLISILIALLLLITVYSVLKGLSIGNIKILGFNDIKSESEAIDAEIATITKMKEQEYKKTISDIESNAKSLLKEKEEYADLVSTSTDSEIQKATHEQKYEQDFLWAKIGNHATAGGVKLKFDIKVGATNKENYDLYFQVTGNYTNITEFVMSLENDNLLGFKIENFKLIPTGASSSSTSKTSTNKTNNNTSKNTNTKNTNNNTTNTTNSDTTTETTSSSGGLIATFKVTDISINIDKTKVTSSTSTATQTTAEEGTVAED